MQCNRGMLVRRERSSREAVMISVICKRRSTITGRMAMGRILVRIRELRVRAVSILAAAPCRLSGSMLTGISRLLAYVMAQVCNRLIEGATSIRTAS